MICRRPRCGFPHWQSSVRGCVEIVDRLDGFIAAPGLGRLTAAASFLQLMGAAPGGRGCSGRYSLPSPENEMKGGDGADPPT